MREGWGVVSTPTARVGLPAWLRPVECDVVRESLVEHVVGLLRQRVLGDRLKCLFHVDGLLGRRLEVGNVVLAITPLLGSSGRDLKDKHSIFLKALLCSRLFY